MSRTRRSRKEGNVDGAAGKIVDTCGDTNEQHPKESEYDENEIDRPITSSDRIEATVCYHDLQHSIRNDLMEDIKNNQPNILPKYKKFQEKSDRILRSYGRNSNDILLMDSKIQLKLGYASTFDCRNKLRSKTIDWIQLKENIRQHLKKNSIKFGMSNLEGCFLSSFPTAIITSHRDKVLNNVSPRTERKNPESEKPKIQRKRRQPLNEDAVTLQPTNKDKADKTDNNAELLLKLEKRIIQVEELHGRKPMPMVKLACDPASFDKTVGNFVNLSALLRKGTLLIFIENGEQMAISLYNAKRTGLEIAPTSNTNYIHYDNRTWEHWIDVHDVRENYFKDF